MRMHDNPTINYPDYIWPEGKRCAVVFSLDLDAESPFLWISRGQTVQHLGEIEQRRYGPRQGVARVTQLFEPRLSIRDFHADLRETGSPAWAHKPSNQCRRWRATAKRSVGMSGFTLGFSQNAPTASTL